jgi:hypothetical protein
VDLSAKNHVALPLARPVFQKKESFRNRSKAMKVYIWRAAEVEMILFDKVADAWLCCERIWGAH